MTMHMRRSSTASRVSGLLLLLGLLLLPTLSAGQGTPSNLEPKGLTDPLDGHKFQWSVLRSTNGMGGWDSDGCTYSSGEQPRSYSVATSPTTLYSARLDDWDRVIPPDRKEELLELLLRIGEDVDDARRMPPYQRYEIAAVVSEYLGDGPLVVGELYLQAAWTVRDSIVGFLPGVQGASDAWKKLEDMLPLLAEVKEPRGRTIACFDLARLCHRGGFIKERDAFLYFIDTFEDAGLGAQEKRSEFFRRVTEESRLLAKAREAFLVGLAEGLGTPEERAYYRYLVGEISRRLGDFADADMHIEASTLDKAAGEEVKGHLRDIKAVLKVQGREDPAVRPGAKEETAP